MKIRLVIVTLMVGNIYGTGEYQLLVLHFDIKEKYFCSWLGKGKDAGKNKEKK